MRVPFIAATVVAAAVGLNPTAALAAHSLTVGEAQVMAYKVGAKLYDQIHADTWFVSAKECRRETDRQVRCVLHFHGVPGPPLQDCRAVAYVVEHRAGDRYAHVPRKGVGSLSCKVAS